MPHSNYAVLVPSLVLAGGATGSVEVDTSDYTECQLFIKVTYGTTASTTGLAASGSDGVGPRAASQNVYVGPPTLNPTQPIYYDNVGTILSLNPTLPSSSNVTTITKLNLLLPQLGNWYKLSFKNNDASNAATISIFADAG